MVEINSIYEGGLHCKAVHKPSGIVLETDAPVDNKGKGESFSPTDLLATSLAVCYLTTMGIAADMIGVDMSGTTCRIEKHMSSDKPRRVIQLSGEVIFEKPIPEDKKAAIEHAGVHCPVSKSIHPDISVNLKFIYK
jgi:putative redox protein